MSAVKKAAYDLVVIGAGSGGLEAAWNAAVSYKANVAVIDTQKSHGPPNYAALGGTCVNVGCVPKKLMVTGANFMESFKDSVGFGWKVDPTKTQHSWQTMMAAKDKAVQGINDSYVEMFETPGLTYVQGWAWIQDKNTVLVREAPNGESTITDELDAKNILIATGSWPFKPSIPGIEHCITSNEAFYLKEAPKNALIVGGGYIAVEFASIFYSFCGEGGSTSLAYRGDLFLRGFDQAVREELRDQMKARGINLMFKENPSEIKKNEDGTLEVLFESGLKKNFDVVMYATGRNPRSNQINLESAGVNFTPGKAIPVDEYSKTNVDNIYAIGDVTDRLQLTPVAIHEGASFADTVFGNKPTKPCHDNVATAVFTIPQIGTCGLTEDQAVKKIKTVAVYQSSFKPLMHNITGAEHKKFLVKVIVDHSDGRVVGVHMCGSDTGEIIQAVGICVKMGAKISDFYSTIGVHPTSAEELCSLRTPSYFMVDGQKHEKLPTSSL